MVLGREWRWWVVVIAGEGIVGMHMEVEEVVGMIWMEVGGED